MSVNATESGSRQLVQDHRNLEIFSDVAMAVSAIAIMIFIILRVAHVPIGLLGTYGPLAANTILLIMIIARQATKCIIARAATATKCMDKKSKLSYLESEKKERERWQGWGKISEAEQNAINFGDKLDNIKKKGQDHPLTESEKAEFVVMLKEVVSSIENLEENPVTFTKKGFRVQLDSAAAFFISADDISFEPAEEVTKVMQFYLVENFKNVKFGFTNGRGSSNPKSFAVVFTWKRELSGNSNN